MSAPPSPSPPPPPHSPPPPLPTQATCSSLATAMSRISVGGSSLVYNCTNAHASCPFSSGAGVTVCAYGSTEGRASVNLSLLSPTPSQWSSTKSATAPTAAT